MTTRLSRGATAVVFVAVVGALPARAQDWALAYGPGTANAAAPTSDGGFVVGGQARVGTTVGGLVFKVDAADRSPGRPRSPSSAWSPWSPA